MDNTLTQNAVGGDGNAQRLPPGLLLAGAIALVALLAAVLTARLTGFDASAVPDSPVIDSRLLGFRDLTGGMVEIYDWDTQEVIERIPSGEGSFLRGVVRSLVRQRRGLDTAAAPFELSLLADRRLILSDRKTGEDIDLNAFGPTNLAVFAALMRDGSSAAPPEPAASSR